MATTNEILERLDKVYPNAYENPVKAGWIMELNRRLYETVVLPHEGKGEYEIPAQYPKDGDLPLAAESPYEELYVIYAMAQMEFYNREGGGFNNSAALYNSLLGEWKSQYHRTHSTAVREIKNYMR